MILCTDCRHLQGKECTKVPMPPDYLTGKERGYVQAQIVREAYIYCGPEAKWFEQRLKVVA